MAKSISELEAELENVKAKNVEALKAERERARKREADVRAAIARAQAKADETWGRRLRMAGATDADIEAVVGQLVQRTRAEAAAAANAVESAPVDVVQQ